MGARIDVLKSHATSGRTSNVRFNLGLAS